VERLLRLEPMNNYWVKMVFTRICIMCNSVI